MQLAALLWFHYWLAQVGCPTPAVLVSHGVGVVLVQLSCYPLVFFVTAQLPLPLLPLRGSAPFPGVLACLTPACWSTHGVGLEGSCCVLFLRACGAHFSLLQVPLGFSGHRGSVLLLPW